MGVIDADAHVFETPRTWEYLDESERAFTPRIVEQIVGDARRGLGGNVQQRFWLIDGHVDALDENIDPRLTKAQRDLDDVDARLAHLDAMGVDVQVVFPSLFLHPYTRDFRIEYALTRSYNRWMADIWRQGNGRLRWVAVAPLMQMDKVADELSFARDNGAVGVLMHGVIQDKRAADPYFDPLYRAAGARNLAVCFHAGYNSFDFHDLFRGSGGMIQFRYPVIAAFHALMMRDAPSLFPDVRWGFLEAGSQWLPMAMKDLARRYRNLLKRELPDDLLASKRIWITCQADDDIPYVLGYSGEDTLVMGTDYGHHDHAADLDAFCNLREACGIPAAVAEKILNANPRALYALD